MEGPRGRARYRGSYSGPRAMSISRSRSRYASRSRSRPLYLARRGVVARRARAMLNRRTAGFLGLEKKFFDTAVAAVALNAASDASAGEFDPTALPGAVACLSAPAQGDGEQNRDGKRIVIKSLQIKGQCAIPAQEGIADPPYPCKVFIAVVQDMQTNGAQLNSEDVFKNQMNTSAGAADPLRNLLFASRFRVLKSGTYDLTPNNNGHLAANDFYHGGSLVDFEWFIPLEMPVNFNSGTTAVIANVIDNSIHVIAYASSTFNTPTIQYNARIRFMG